MDRGRTEREYSGYTRGSSLMYVVLPMTLLTALSSGYMAISRCNIETTLNNRRYMETQPSSKTIHRSLCEAVSSGESLAVSLIQQSFQENCDRLREGFDGMMDEEEVEEGEDGELKIEASSLEEGMDAEEDMATEGDTATKEDIVAEEEIRWERRPYHTLGNKKYVVRGEGVSEGSGVIDDDVAEAPAVDSPATIDTTLAVQPLKSLAMVHTRVVSNGYSFSLMTDIIFGGRDGFVMVTRKPYRSSEGNGPEVKAYLNGNGIYRCYEGS